MRERENIWMLWTTDYLQLEVDGMNCKKTVVENQDKPVKITINVLFLLPKISKTFYCFAVGKVLGFHSEIKNTLFLYTKE